MKKYIYRSKLEKYNQTIDSYKLQIKYLEEKYNDLRRFFYKRTVEEAESAFYDYHLKLINGAPWNWEPTTESYFDCHFNKTLKSEIMKNKVERNKYAKEINNLKAKKKKLQREFNKNIN